MKQKFNARALFIIAAIFIFSACGGSNDDSGGDEVINTDRPTSIQKIMFIHHSCGQNWLTTGNGNLGAALNENNYYATESNYGWSAVSGDGLGNSTDTGDWPSWFNETKMPHVYANDYMATYTNTLTDPGTDNDIIMFKSCYPLSEVGTSIDDEKGIYNSLLPYFESHPDKLFILITPPGTNTVSSYALTKELCNWLVDRENGWLKDYPYRNVAVFDFYCVLSEVNSHHRIVGGRIEYVYASDYDGTRPYQTTAADDHPDATGNRKATEEFIPLLNYYYNAWKNQ